MYISRYENRPHMKLGGKQIAGQSIRGEAEITVLAQGAAAMLVMLRAKKGYDNSIDGTGHVHPDHESIAYVISGKIEMRIGDQVHALLPGSTWHHPRGVRHTSYAVEDSVVLEFHTPLRQDILDL